MKILTLLLLFAPIYLYGQKVNNPIVKIVGTDVPFTVEELCKFSKMPYKDYTKLKLKDVYLKYELEKIDEDPYLFRIYFYDYNLFKKYLKLIGLTEYKIWTDKIVDKTRFTIFQNSFDDEGKRLFDEHNRMYFIISFTY